MEREKGRAEKEEDGEAAGRMKKRCFVPSSEAGKKTESENGVGMRRDKMIWP